MRWFLLCLLLTLSMLASGLPARTRAADSLQFQYSGQDAAVELGSTDPAGCVFTNVRVGAIDGRIKQGSQPETSSHVFVLIGQYNACTDTRLIAAIGQAPVVPVAFQIDPQLSTATLNATLEVFDYVSARSYPVDISVNWTATGDAVRLKGSTQTRSAGFLVSERFDGSGRQATAAGTVSLNGAPNLTPEPQRLAQILSVRTATTEISR